MKKTKIAVFSIFILLFVFMLPICADAEGLFKAVVFLPDGETKEYLGFDEAWSFANDNKDSTIKILDDWEINSTLVVGKNTFDYSKVTLDLNGFNINAKGKRAFYIPTGILSDENAVNELTVIDTSENKTGQIKNTLADNGGAFLVEGILNLNGGTVLDAKATENGGTVYLKDVKTAENKTNHLAGKLIIDGGVIVGSEVKNRGGAVFASQNGIVELKSGKISDCSAKNGGGVFVSQNAVCKMEKDFKIEQTSAKEMGGAVFVEYDSEFIMQGGLISSCTANQGGAIFVSRGMNDDFGKLRNAGKATIIAGCITSNTCLDSGGAIFTQAENYYEPSQLIIKNSALIFENNRIEKKGSSENNVFLATCDISSYSAYVNFDNSDFIGKVGVNSEIIRKISKNTEKSVRLFNIYSDLADRRIEVDEKSKSVFLFGSNDDPGIVWIDLENDNNHFIIYDYTYKTITIFVPREIKDFEVAKVYYQGENAYEYGGAWQGTHPANSFDMFFTNMLGVLLNENSLLISGKKTSEHWTISLQQANYYEFYVENGSELNHEIKNQDISKSRSYYDIYCGEFINVEASDAPEGMVFDRWLVNADSGIVLGDEAFDASMTIKLEGIKSGESIGLKATYKPIESNNKNIAQIIKEKIPSSPTSIIIIGAVSLSIGVLIGVLSTHGHKYKDKRKK